MDQLTGFFKGAGQQLLNQAQDVIKQKAAEFIQDAIQDVFEKKHVDTKRIIPSIKSLKVLGERGSPKSTGSEQDFHAIRSGCLSSGSLFEDPDFPANDSSISSRRPDRHIEWRRPMEIADDPQFFVEGYSRFDVQQGELGDCWLLAAAATLTQDPKLFFRVVPDDNSFEENYAGIFHFRFWQYGKWVDVVIDDLLPTYRGELMYMRSTEKNEFWSALLEKAYAKLHGSYEALKGGTTCEALEDFTGGVAEMYELKEAPSNLFHILVTGFERNSMMGCSIEPDPNVLEAETPEGLIRGHAYSITKVKFVDIQTPSTTGKIPLLRLRNPWGNEAEWNGPWSDNAPEWRYISDDVRQEIGLVSDVDGEFWMSYRDFLKYFDRVEICNLSPDSLSDEQVSQGKRRWEMSVFEGEWTAGVTAGGCRNYLETFWHNPQYVMTLDDPDYDDDDGKCTVIVALMQKNRRSRRNMGSDCLTIGFAIYKVTDRDLDQKPLKMNFFKYNASVARSPSFINLREVSCRFKLDPGHYLIVPSTFDPNEEGEFLIRVFSECANNMEENDEAVGYDGGPNTEHKLYPDLPLPSAPPKENQELENLFIRVVGPDQEVDWIELKRILDYSMKDEFPKYQQISGIESAQHVTQTEAGFGDGPGGGGGANDSLGPIIQLLCGLVQSFCANQAKEADQRQGEVVPLNRQDPVPVIASQPTGFSKDICRSMIAMYDTDQSGKLGFDEFKKLLLNIEKWKAVFKVYDETGCGRLPAFQLREALASAGYSLNNHIVSALGHRYGSRDGTIAFDDFIMCAVKIKTMIDIFRDRDASGTGSASFNLDEWITQTVYS